MEDTPATFFLSYEVVKLSSVSEDCGIKLF